MNEEQIFLRLTEIQSSVLEAHGAATRACEAAAHTKEELAKAILHASSETSVKIQAVQDRLDRSFGDSTARIGGAEFRIGSLEKRVENVESRIEKESTERAPCREFVAGMMAARREERAESRVVRRWRGKAVAVGGAGVAAVGWAGWPQLKAAAHAIWTWLRGHP